MNRKINVGLIGYGYWGINILRNLIEQINSGTVSVCDSDEKRVNAVKLKHFNLRTYTHSEAIFSDPEIEAVVIATPTSTHYALAKQALLKGKHVLVEKPLSTSSKEVEELMQIAEMKKLVLMVDHIYLYHPVVQYLKNYLDKDRVGKINYIDATRINLGIYQHDTNVLWDLACHDISIINYLIDEDATQIRAIGRMHPTSGIEDLAYLFLHYPSGLLVQINSSWASPVKMRKMIIGGERQMIIYDDIESTNKLIIYDYAHKPLNDENKSKLIDFRLGDITIPKYEISEALKNVVAEFYECVSTGKQPLANGENALAVVRILEKAQESLKSNGEMLNIT